MMLRYFGRKTCTGILSAGPFVLAAHVFAGDGQVVVTRDVPYQSAAGPRHTGQASGVDAAPDTPMKAASIVRTGAVTELTDQESSAIASRVQGHTGRLAAAVQATPGQAGLVSGKFGHGTGMALAATGGLGPLAAGMGAHAGGSASRATGGLGSSLACALLPAAGGTR